MGRYKEGKDNMTWIDLVKNEINSLEKKKVKIKTQLDKYGMMIQ